MRRKNDAYMTPKGLTRALIDSIPYLRTSSVYEPCNGSGQLTEVLRGVQHGGQVTTGDIDPQYNPDFLGDARTLWPVDWPEKLLQDKPMRVNWLVTNPPFNQAMEMLSFWHAKFGSEISHGIALLLRLTFLEPTGDREDFLTQHPPNSLIVLPRTSFTLDGKTDSVICAWMVWNFNRSEALMPSIKVYSKEQLKELDETTPA